MLEESNNENTQSTPAPKKATRMEELKKEIEEEKAKRSISVEDIKKKRGRLRYKEAEFENVSRLSQENNKAPHIGRLKRMKENLEFRIATEAKTLEHEKELVRKINDIDKQLEDAIKVFRLKKKVSYIKGDIELLKTEIDELSKKIEESDVKLDALYDELRRINGFSRDRNRNRMPRDDRKGEHDAQQSISLEDIAIIKKAPKSKDKENSKEVID